MEELIITLELHDSICTSSHSPGSCPKTTNPAFHEALKALVDEETERFKDDFWDGHARGYHEGWEAACEMWNLDPNASPDDDNDPALEL